ncbi:MAG: AAA-like domain-containing protein [Bacteroidetes bacterium]|nr:AAA-like domain-containing protein [Bacteroidota bacterium]
MEIFNTIIGSSAEGKHYFHRDYLDQRLWQYIEHGNQLLVSAPRRIGKTSFLLNICNQKKEGYNVKYHITESINRENDFFKRLYKSLLEEVSTKQNLWVSISEIVKKNKIAKIGPGAIELKSSDLNYFEEFKRLIHKIDLDETLIFVIDEFSETTENIINDQGGKAGKLFLHQNRELRQDKNINRKIRFIYSGSIGLGNITERIGAIKIINDLTDFQIPPFTENEALEMITQLTVAKELIFDEIEKRYLLNKLHWLMPYYIQIVLDETETLLLRPETILEVKKKTINQAIDESLKRRNYFEHWHTRLRTTFKGKYYTFAKEILNAASKSKTGISKTTIFDLAEKFDLREEYNTIIRSLEYDGYISISKKNIYVFNSPILKIWWERNISI